MALGLSEERLASFGVSRESYPALQIYVELLLQWQTHINLIGSSTVADVWERHIADSLQLLPLMREANPSLADLGSGAGLPGLVISIAAGTPAELYESNGKKAAFLREAIRLTKADARVHHIRIESLTATPPLHMPTYVVARALAPLATLLAWAMPFLDQGAIGLFHKGQHLEGELTEATKYRKIEISRHPSQTERGAAILEVRTLRHDS
jgi:16S rRNA (guanine527-N7)-methyltransferase